MSPARNPESNALLRDFMADIAKIVEGAMAADPDRVRAYTKHLADRLHDAGEDAAARRLERAFGQRPARSLSLAGQATAALPVDSESRMPLADEESVVGLEAQPVLPGHVRVGLDRFIQYVKAADRFTASGVGVSASLLLYGPPGCGKTLVARQVAHELNLPLITARTDSLISSYLGSTAKNIRMLFEHAISRPCVLFLDEFDALGKMRDDAHELGELKRVVISLLQNIDAMGSDHVLIAATNHEHLLDRAIWRRFAHKFQLDYPALYERERLLSQFLAGFANESDPVTLAQLTDGVSGGELLELSREAIRSAILEGRDKIDLAEVLTAIGRARPNGPEWHKLSTEGRIEALKALAQGKLTQIEIAKLVGVTQPHVSRSLRRERKINDKQADPPDQGCLSK